MKFLTLFILLAATGLAQPLNQERFLYAVRQVETGNGWDGTPGRHGEVSHWQITPGVWRQHTALPFSLARDPAHAKAVAAKHARWLAAGLQRAGYTPTPARVGTAWNVGLEGFLRSGGRITDHGQRIANLYAAK
ncbi:MAG TPA: hypothetical protein VGD88_06220 [Opitutaceae bacterium]